MRQDVKDAIALTKALHDNQIEGQKLRAKRQAAFTALKKAGWSMPEIARVVKLTSVRVGQIINEGKRKR